MRLWFNIAQHSREELLIKSLVEYLGCGIVYSYPDVITFNIFSLSDLRNKLVPFFEKYPIKGVKALDYSDFKKIANLVQNK